MTDLTSRKPNHEARISQRFAISLAGAIPLPAEGQELVVARTRGKQKLVMINVAGQYRLHCDSCPREHWSLVFGVAIPESESL